MKMTKRTHRYLVVKRILQLAKIQAKHGCIEFPAFGARYPDATCIDGVLWDLDSGDGEGLTSGGDIPCPVCSTKSYINDLSDNGESINGILEHIKFILTRYGNVKD
jgi:hypothetical protein